MEALALALRDGLKLASSCFCDRVLMESDSLEVVDACRNILARSEIVTIVEDIAQMKNWFAECAFVWTP